MRFTCSNRRDYETILRVSPRTLDLAFAATDPRLYALVRPGRVEQLMKVPDESPLGAPSIWVADGCLHFENGRHRARAAMLLGLRTIPVVVDPDNVTAVRELLARFKGR